MTLKLNKIQGFSLIEMLFVIIIIGILIFIALPDHTSVITKAKAVEAKMQLSHIHSLEKAYFWANSSYSGDPRVIGFEQELLVSEGGSANYRIEITEYDSKGFVARAVAVVDFDQDGVFNIWEINENKQITEIQPD